MDRRTRTSSDSKGTGSVLATLAYLRKEGGFRHVLLKGWDEARGDGEYWLALPDDLAPEFRNNLLPHLKRASPSQVAVDILGQILRARTALPNLKNVDLLSQHEALLDDTEDTPGNLELPPGVIVTVSFGAKRESAVKQAESPASTRSPLVTSEDVRREKDRERGKRRRFEARFRAEEDLLDAGLPLGKGKGKGRPGYYERILEADPEWPEFRASPQAKDAIDFADSVWMRNANSLQAVADALNARGVKTLSGRAFAKASVVPVVIGVELIRGNNFPDDR